MSVSNTMGDVRSSAERSTWSAASRAVLLGTLIAGTMDICAAITSWTLRGVPAIRVLQGVAAGLLGTEAPNGGAGSAALGLLLHYLIMLGIVATFHTAARRCSPLAQHWGWSGLAYGIVVYAVMTFIVVPLSAAPPSGIPAPADLVRGLLVHVTCVGLPIAFISHRAQRAMQTPGG